MPCTHPGRKPDGSCPYNAEKHPEACPDADCPHNIACAEPTAVVRRPVTPAVRALLDARERKGIETYGESLHTHNGRPGGMPRDAAEEAIDLAQYAIGWGMERADLLAEIAQLRAHVEQLEAQLANSRAETAPKETT